MGITLEGGANCGYPSIELGLRVLIGNSGEGAAGPFVVEANGVQRTDAVGLGPGQELAVWMRGYAYPGANSVTVDATDIVAESDETNNTQTTLLPVPTPPPTCTPTPTATAHLHTGHASTVTHAVADAHSNRGSAGRHDAVANAQPHRDHRARGDDRARGPPRRPDRVHLLRRGRAFE